MTAKYSSFFGRMMDNPLAVAMAAPVAGIAIGGTQMLGERLMDARAKATGYKGMLELHPKLRNHKDRKGLHRMYSSLYNIAPTMARDPLVAGAWVDNVMESNRQYGEDGSNQALLGAVKDLAGIRNQLSAARKNEGANRWSAGGAASAHVSTLIGAHQTQRAADTRDSGQAVQLRLKIDEMRQHQSIKDTTRRLADERMAEARRKHSSAAGATLLAAIR